MLFSANYKIRDINVAPALVLAPMSGVTTSAFRRLIKELNPGVVGAMLTEFISVEALTRQVPRSLAMLKFDSSERPLGIQIFGYDPVRMRDAAMMAQDAGADFVDINCGCPAPKVVRRGGGCELMRQPEHLAKIIAAVKAAITVPLTIKIRAGWDDSSKNALEVAKMAQGQGVDALAVHGRTRAQLYRGLADWDLVSQVAQELKIPVLGSGDVVCTQSAQQRMKTGISGIFIGRGALLNPYVFTDVAYGAEGFNPKRNDPFHMLDIIERYIELLSIEFPPKAIIGKVKQLVSQACRGLPYRKDLVIAKDFDHIKEVITRYREIQASGLPLNNINIVENDNHDNLDLTNACS